MNAASFIPNPTLLSYSDVHPHVLVYSGVNGSSIYSKCLASVDVEAVGTTSCRSMASHYSSLSSLPKVRACWIESTEHSAIHDSVGHVK
jgi:hypothetical protein